MSLTSTPQSITIQSSGGATSLLALATSMVPGQWAPFTMPNLSAATFSAVAPGGGEPCTINTFGNKLSWDSTHRKINYAGTAHTSTSPPPVAGAGKFSLWDDSTNLWSFESYNGWYAGAPGHSYYHNAVNKTTGDFYFRSYNSRSVWRHPYGQTGEGAWDQAFSTIPLFGNWSNEVAGGLEWYPELNGGAGGLVFYNQLGPAYTNAALTSWTWAPGTFEGGQYHNWSAYSGGFVYFGGGAAALPSGNNSGMWRMDPTGAVTQMPNTPVTAAANGNVVLPHPSGSGLILFESGTDQNPISLPGNMWVFNGTSWSGPSSAQIGITNGAWAGCAITLYGVILIIQAQNFNAPSCIVFKPIPAYNTSFNLTQNPISEGGAWTNGKATGTNWSNVQSQGGIACGTQTPAPTGNFDDSIACLSNFPPNQSAQGTLFRGAGWTGSLECELLLRFSITNGVARGYEIDYYQDRVFVVHWNGAKGDFTIVNAGGTTINSVSGDVMYAEMNGSTLTVKKNGAIVYTNNMQTWAAANGKTYWATGNPGIGFYVDTAITPVGNNNQAGWADYVAGSL